MRTLAVIFASLAVSGCVTAEQRMAADDAKCRSYGVAPGTPPYVQCRMLQDQNRTAKEVAILGGGSSVTTVLSGAGQR